MDGMANPKKALLMLARRASTELSRGATLWLSGQGFSPARSVVSDGVFVPGFYGPQTALARGPLAQADNATGLDI
ncbi:hypothetical protein GB937_006032 [Aspergillus fischeri]|nr:hypothetical protein GB937_006032 [Aspergillus fischeri]